MVKKETEVWQLAVLGNKYEFELLGKNLDRNNDYNGTPGHLIVRCVVAAIWE